MITIGSKAMKHYGLLNRECSDWDIIGTVQEFDEFCQEHKDNIILSEVLTTDKHHLIIKGIGHVEWEFAWIGSTGEELINICKEYNLHENGFVYPCVQLTLKLSHRYRRNFKHFNKTMDDIITLREQGTIVPDCLQAWLKRREDETYTTNRPNLKQSKRDFFNTEGVTYKYDHDSIHGVVARFDVPCYEHFKDDKAEVFCSKTKFEEQSEEIKLGSVVEESLVLALERCLVPFSFNTNPRTAFLMALEKVCTSITSGWWREYAYDNYYQAIELFDTEYSDFVDKFLDGLYNGDIKLHEG